jgi:hypothetical protein
MTHLTREQLKDFWDHGRAGDRERVVTHLAVCDQCGALYGEVMDGSPTAIGTSVASPNLAVRGYRSFRAARRRFTMRWTGALAGAAAAAGLVALVLPSPSAPPPPDGETIRGASLVALAPIGRVDPPVRFRWASPVAASRFVVEVRDGRQRLQLVLTAAREAVDLPAESLRQLVPAEDYSWVVIARDAEGQEIMRSRPQIFSVAAGPR